MRRNKRHPDRICMYTDYGCVNISMDTAEGKVKNKRVNILKSDLDTVDNEVNSQFIY